MVSNLGCLIIWFEERPHHKIHSRDSPSDTVALNDAEAGTGTSTTDWVNLVVGEGGVIDWVVPGWRGEYKSSK